MNTADFARPTSRRRSPPRARRFRFALEGFLLRTLVGVCQRIPPRAHGLTARLATAMAACLPIRRRRILHENLRQALGIQEAARLRRLSRQVLQNTVQFGLELARMARARPEEILQAVQCDPHDRHWLQQIRSERRGCLLVSAHIGNWEWLGAWYSLTYGDLGVVAKPMHNPRSERLIRRIRQRFGIRRFSTRDRLPRALMEHLRAGGIAAILPDQDARRQGAFIPFFGRAASTATGPAALAIRLGVPMVPGFLLREAPARFRLVLGHPMHPQPGADPRTEEIRLMREYHGQLENVIRRAPAQYFWWHRRWKTRPPRAG